MKLACSDELANQPFPAVYRDFGKPCAVPITEPSSWLIILWFDGWRICALCIGTDRERLGRFYGEQLQENDEPAYYRLRDEGQSPEKRAQAPRGVGRGPCIREAAGEEQGR